MEIQRISGGDISNGGTVLVSYSAADESEHTTSVTDRSFTSTVKLLENHVSLYGRVHDVDGTSTRQLALADALEQTAGIKLSGWRMSVGGEYQDRSSASASYTATRTYQSCSLRFGKRSSAQLRANQTERDYRDSPKTQWTRSYIIRYNTYPRRGLSLNIQGGISREEGTGRHRNRATARAKLRYSIRRLAMSVSYDFEDEQDKATSRDNNEQSISVRITRRF